MPFYLTPDGARRYAEELNRLLKEERPKIVREVADAAAQGDRSENAEYIYGKKRLREIDRRVRFLSKRLDASVVVRSEEIGDTGSVRFGALVTVKDEEGRTRSYTIVGPDEAEPTSGRISFQSPLGRSLMKKKVGDVVTVFRPAGEIEVEVMQISYGEDG